MTVQTPNPSFAFSLLFQLASSTSSSVSFGKMVIKAGVVVVMEMASRSVTAYWTGQCRKTCIRHLTKYRGKAQFWDCFLITKERMQCRLHCLDCSPQVGKKNQPTDQTPILMTLASLATFISSPLLCLRSDFQVPLSGAWLYQAVPHRRTCTHRYSSYSNVFFAAEQDASKNSAFIGIFLIRIFPHLPECKWWI